MNVTSRRIAVTVAKLFPQVLFHIFSSEPRKWILWQFENRGGTDDFAQELRYHLKNRYSLLVEHTETTGMIVSPTRMDRVRLKYLYSYSRKITFWHNTDLIYHSLDIHKYLKLCSSKSSLCVSNLII